MLRRHLILTRLALLATAVVVAGAAPRSDAAAIRSGLCASDADCADHLDDVVQLDLRYESPRPTVLHAAARGWLVYDTSPSGSSIVYGKDGIFTARIDGGGSKRIAEGRSGEITFARWSPDGTKIAFIKPDQGQCHAIWVLGVDGRNPRGVSRCGLYPAWSPDSRKLAFFSVDGTTQTLTVASVDGAGSHVVAPWIGLWNEPPTWSPRGNSIAYTAGRRAPSVFIVDEDGTNRHLIGHGVTPSWSPDGKRLVLVRREAAALGLAKTALPIVERSGKAVRLLDSDPTVAHPAWSPSGGTVAYSHGVGRARVAQVFLVRTDGTHRRQASFDRELGGIDRISWGRGGTRLLYLRARC